MGYCFVRMLNGDFEKLSDVSQRVTGQPFTIGKRFEESLKKPDAASMRNFDSLHIVILRVISHRC